MTDMRLSKNFMLHELCVTNQPYDNTPPPDAVTALSNLTNKILQPLRDATGVPVNVTSGYRSAKVNTAVGGSRTSQHRLGEAADIVVAGMAPRQVCELIIKLGLPFDQLIQEYGRWVHVSYGPKNRRQVLTAHRGLDGKTQYLKGLV
jgi:zinc D-Ala-D-Ala carboxypeptidase